MSGPLISDNYSTPGEVHTTVCIEYVIKLTDPNNVSSSSYIRFRRKSYVSWNSVYNLDFYVQLRVGRAISRVEVLDIGTDPMPHTAFCAAPWIQEITLSDFSQKNLEFIQKWKDEKINLMGLVLEYLVQSDKSSRTVEERQDELRKKIKNTLLSVTSQSPILSLPLLWMALSSMPLRHHCA
ncbi:hypothetical protein CHS0354_021982 [Potamilus streckersoni]|uniref:Uncharacterized protein n=1 Tax=Potamilus streckersoni TaxID=2493646 RepID=A0AAE0SKI6_9BIVA|nr:hypothetical protein CHS0354_021982 [Potamilus streckersoni]